jgi:hypothetical protein
MSAREDGLLWDSSDQSHVLKSLIHNSKLTRYHIRPFDGSSRYVVDYANQEDCDEEDEHLPRCLKHGVQPNDHNNFDGVSIVFQSSQRHCN